MADFQKKQSNSYQGKMKFALVREEEKYKGQTYVKWKGSFSDGSHSYLIDMGELNKVYDLTNGKRAYFGNVVKFNKNSR